MRSYILTFPAILAGLLASGQVRAEDCSCDQYKSIIPVAGLSSDVAAIGAKALHKDGAQFYMGSDAAAALRLRIDADKTIPDRCKGPLKKAIPMNTVDLTIRGAIIQPSMAGSPYDSGEVGGLHSVFNDYYQKNYLNAFLSGCGPKPDGSNAQASATYTSCVQSFAPQSWKKFGQFMNGTPESIANATGVSVDNAKILKAYNLLLNAGSEAGMIAAIKAGKDGLSTEQFLTLVQLYGHQLSNDYDMARTKKGTPSSKGAISGDQIYTAARNNTMYGIGASGSGDPAGSLMDYEGVCRDIAAAQGKLLEAKGFKNTYIVHYSTSSGGHATVITQDPTKPRQLYAINYDERSNRKDVDGAQALMQGASGGWANDYTINYRVYKPGGRLLVDVPSEMGKFLTEAAGFDVHTLDGLARPAPSMMSANVALGNEKYRGQLRLVTGEDGTGGKYVGAAADVSWNPWGYFPGKAGIFGGQQNRPAAAFGRPVDSNVGVIYAQVEQHAVTPKLKINPNISVQGDAYGTFMVNYTTIMTGENQGDTNTRYDHKFGAEVRVEQTAADGKYKGVYRVGVQGQVDSTDNRNQDASSMALLPTKVYAGATATYQVKPDVTLFGDALVVADALGARGKLEAGVASRYIAGSAYVAGRLTDDTALIQDNSIRRVGLGVTVSPNKYFSLGVSGEIPIEGDDPLSKFRLFGTGTLKF